jgi:hypothetical protein
MLTAIGIPNMFSNPAVNLQNIPPDWSGFGWAA